MLLFFLHKKKSTAVIGTSELFRMDTTNWLCQPQVTLVDLCCDFVQHLRWISCLGEHKTNAALSVFFALWSQKQSCVLSHQPILMPFHRVSDIK